MTCRDKASSSFLAGESYKLDEFLYLFFYFLTATVSSYMEYLRYKPTLRMATYFTHHLDIFFYYYLHVLYNYIILIYIMYYYIPFNPFRVR